MIKISVDEAYAFDMLAILDVKLSFAQEDEAKLKLKHSFSLLEEEIKKKVGVYLYNKIINSEEFNDLINANLQIFVAIDMLNNNLGEVEASYVNDLNYQRYKVKSKLQSNFFPQINQTELKQGYH